MLYVDIGRVAAVFLRRGDDVQSQRGFTGGLRAVDLDDAAFGHAADAERQIQRQRAGGQGLDVDGDIVAQTHDRAFAVVFLDFRDRRFQRLFPVSCVNGRDGHSLLFLCHVYPPLGVREVRRIIYVIVSKSHLADNDSLNADGVEL